MASKRKDEIIQAVIETNLINEKGDLPPWSSTDYQKAVDIINNIGNGPKISRDYLYTILKNDRYNIVTTIKTKLGIEDVATYSPENTDESDSISDDEIKNETANRKDMSFSLINLGRHERQAKNYVVNIPYASYEPIKPYMKLIHTKNGPRNIWKLQKGWIDIFLDHFFDEYGFPCSYTIKYHNVFLKSINNDYISFKGRCNDKNCLKPFFGWIKDVPTPGENVVVHFLAVNTIGIKHSQKRFLREPKRSYISENVANSGASQWRRKMADNLMDYGDVEPPNLYKSSVLRKAKQQHQCLTLGIGGKDPIQSINTLKYEVEHSGSIHNIGCDPFFCHYWIPTQDHIYKQKRSKSWTTVFLDATGSLVLPISRTKNLSSAHIFLYQMVTEIENQTVPISQQLSEKQDMLSIYYWLASWINTGLKPPNECVCDYSKALLGGITRSFCNRKSLREYNSMCFEYLIKQNNLLPECFVRVDVAHIIHMLCRWKCLKTRKPIRDFYVRCICLLIKMHNIKEFKSTLEMIFIVAYSETDGIDCNFVNTPAENARKHLIEHISHGSIDHVNSEYEENDCYKGITKEEKFFINEDDNEIDIEETVTSTIEKWINNINNFSIEKSKTVGDRLNALYCPDLIKPLIRICLDFPLWSAIMVQPFKSPNSRSSSARVEGYFSTLKSSIILKKTTRMCVDKFIITHLRAIRGDIKLVGCNDGVNSIELTNNTSDEHENNTKFKDIIFMKDEDEVNSEIYFNSSSSNTTEVNSNSSSNLEFPEETLIENWRNKALKVIPEKTKSTTAKRSIYLENHPEIKTKQQINKNISKYRIDLIRNGNIMQPLSIGLKKQKQKCKIMNTCAFDALLQAIATGYMDSQAYANYVDSKECATLKLATHLIKEGANSIFYDKRFQILKETCKKKCNCWGFD